MKNTLVVLLFATLAMAGCNNADTKNFEQSAQNGTQKLTKAVESGMGSAKLKSVLMASPKLDASHINVDKDQNTFYLRGTVPNEEQKTLANRIAQDTIAKDEKVVDDLKIEAGGAKETPGAGTPEATSTVIETTTTTTATVTPAPSATP